MAKRGRINKTQTTEIKTLKQIECLQNSGKIKHKENKSRVVYKTLTFQQSSVLRGTSSDRCLVFD
jgi:hypothetical protein